MVNLNEDELLDTCGLLCPEPVMLLYNRMRDLAPEKILKVLATDPSTWRDIPQFCRFIGHELLDRQRGDIYIYYIKKSTKR